MTEHLSDEEQLEALKRWWKESGRQVLVAIVIAVLAYFGWNGWQDQQQQQAEQASALYEQMMGAANVTPGADLSDEQRVRVTYLAVSLQDQHGGSQYAQYASLMLAKLAVEKNDLDTAVSELQSVVDDASEGLSLIARIRLAKVEAARENYESAIELLESADAKALAAAYAEALGDIYYQQSKPKQAYKAYQKALDATSADDRTRSILELKINQVLPRQDEQSETELSEGDA